MQCYDKFQSAPFRPINSNIRVIPCNSALIVRVIEIIALVKEFGKIREDKKPGVQSPEESGTEPGFAEDFP